MESPVYFGSYSREKRCRFFKCKDGAVASENVGSDCVFQGSFPWKPLQTLETTGKKDIMKACTTSYLETVTICEQGLDEVYILNNLKWIEDCTLDPGCQAVGQVSCVENTCDLNPDSCTGGQHFNISQPNPSPSSPPNQVPPGEDGGYSDEQEPSGSGDDDGSFLSSGNGTEALSWPEQVNKGLKKFLIHDGKDGNEESLWKEEGRQLMLMTLDKPVNQITIGDVWSTGIESIRMTGELGQEIHQLQQQIGEMSTWSWRFNLGLLLPTSLAVATSLLILGNFCYKSHKFIAERVNKVWAEKAAQKVQQAEKAKNLDALDVAIRIESMRMGRGGQYGKHGMIQLSDCDGRPIGTYNPTRLTASKPESGHPQPFIEESAWHEDSPALPSYSDHRSSPDNVSTTSSVVNEKITKKTSKRTKGQGSPQDVPQQAGEVLTMEAWKKRVKHNLRDDDYD